MRRTSWACFRLGLALLLLGLCPGAWSQAERIRQADVVYSSDTQPPPATADWRPVELPFASKQNAAWYRVRFQVSANDLDEAWATCLPYLYTGGRLFLNGNPLSHIPEPTPELIVRWERPHLILLPTPLLRSGTNELLVRIAATPISSGFMPPPAVGPYSQLLPLYESRLFWVRTMSQFTVISCLIVGALSVFIWLRRREEALYGLFGAAALLWGMRSLTLIVEAMPASQWYAWRMIYHAATGGFVIVMLLFAMRLAEMSYARLTRPLLAYWLLGPLAYIAGVGDAAIGRYWGGGLVPVGVAVLVISIVAAWRQRGLALGALSIALVVAVLAGVHDYLLASAAPLLKALAPELAAQRIFLLHYGADLVLVVMGCVLSVRMIVALQTVEQLNRTLESRVAQRETALLDNYQRLRLLERQHAASEERQQIMRDLHDGLGSQLFLTLSKAEMGQIDQDDMVRALRECIADMRLTLEAMSPESHDFMQAWGNFRFRWQHLLESAGLQSSWQADAWDGGFVELTPHATVQLLRIVQEALTNVLRHAQATRVAVRLHVTSRAMTIEIRDDGRGIGAAPARAGRGLANMRARASQLGGRLDIGDLHPGLRVALEVDRAAAAATAPDRPAPSAAGQNVSAGGLTSAGLPARTRLGEGSEGSLLS